MEKILSSLAIATALLVTIVIALGAVENNHSDISKRCEKSYLSQLCEPTTIEGTGSRCQCYIPEIQQVEIWVPHP